MKMWTVGFDNLRNFGTEGAGLPILVRALLIVIIIMVMVVIASFV